MKSKSLDLALFVLGIMVSATIFLTEIIPVLSFLGAATYILVIIFILWIPGQSSYVTALGIITTFAIIAGYLITTAWFDITWEGFNDRLFTLGIVWLAIFFTFRYRHFINREKKQKEQLKALFENATEGLLIVDTKGHIVLINRWAEKMFGYGPSELINAAVEKLVPARFAKTHVLHRENYTHHPVSRSLGKDLTLLGVRKDGTEFPVEISLSHFETTDGLFVIAFIIDATDRKKAAENIQHLQEQLEHRVEERTRELAEALNKLEDSNQDLQQEILERQVIEEKLISSQRLHEAMAHNFPKGIIGVLNRDLNYVFIDGKELHDLGISQRKLIGLKFYNDEYPLFTAQSESNLKRAFKGETVSFEVTLSDRDYNVTAVPLPDHRGNVNEILVVAKNISHIKKMQADLLQALEKERELGELKSRFVTTASHEFRTPLSTILSSIFLLENYTGDEYEREKILHINRIKRSVNNLTEILNDFLSLGKLEEGKVQTSFTTIDVEDFLETLINETEVIRNTGQSIRYTHSGDTNIYTDKQLLKNIILNLLSNALKYSPKNSPVHIATAVNNQDLVLTITDFGIGIPEEDQRHIFKRFFRARNATNIEGTGLGLNIVKKYVSLLMGTIHFTSHYGEGTTFTVTLPVSPLAQQQTERKVSIQTIK